MFDKPTDVVSYSMIVVSYFIIAGMFYDVHKLCLYLDYV